MSEQTQAPQNQEFDAIEDVLKGIDIDALSKDDVFTDVIHNAKLFAFRLMVSAGLLERIILKSREKEAGNEPQQPVQASASAN